MANSSFLRLLRRTGLLAAAPAEEEPPEEEVCTVDIGVRPAGTTRLGGSPDDELPLLALLAPSRDESGADGVVLFVGRRPARRFLLQPLLPESSFPDIALFHCALVLPLLLLPPPLLSIIY